MKTYGDKKDFIREEVLKASQVTVVKNIMVLDLSQQEQLKKQGILTPGPRQQQHLRVSGASHNYEDGNNHRMC